MRQSEKFKKLSTKAESGFIEKDHHFIDDLSRLKADRNFAQTAVTCGVEGEPKTKVSRVETADGVAGCVTSLQRFTFQDVASSEGRTRARGLFFFSSDFNLIKMFFFLKIRKLFSCVGIEHTTIYGALISLSAMEQGRG